MNLMKSHESSQFVFGITKISANDQKGKENKLY